MKHGILILAACIFYLLWLKYAYRKKTAGLAPAGRSRQAQIRKSHRQPVNAKKTSRAKSRKKVPAKSRGKRAVPTA